MKEFIEKLIKELETGIFSKDEIRNYNSSTQENMICQNKGIKYAIRKVNELAEEYKDAEEQGLLLRLPCKVGDTIYFVDFDENEYDEAIVESIEFGRNGFVINSDCEIGTNLGAEYLFLTKEEAEQALKQIGE